MIDDDVDVDVVVDDDDLHLVVLHYKILATRKVVVTGSEIRFLAATTGSGF